MKWNELNKISEALSSIAIMAVLLAVILAFLWGGK